MRMQPGRSTLGPGILRLELYCWLLHASLEASTKRTAFGTANDESLKGNSNLHYGLFIGFLLFVVIRAVL